MMTNNKSVSKILIFISILFFSLVSLNAETEKTWVVAAEKFSLAKGQKSTPVTEGFTETIPVSIMEQLCKTIERNVLPDERLEREKYRLRKDRQSLYLQLSSEYKKRDALVLNDYSDFELKTKIREENKAIKAIQDKIDENLKEVKKLEDENETQMNLVYKGNSESAADKETELQLIKNLFKKIFTQNESIITQENIKVYQGDFTRLYFSSSEAEKNYSGGKFEAEMQSAGINSLLTGQITSYGDYLSISVDVYLYPGAKKIGSVTEVGSSQEINLLASSIANQIVPMLANSMPVIVNISCEPQEAAANCLIYIDDIIQNSMDNSYIISSGVHTIQFIADGYKTAGTSYYFKGNTNYNIEVSLQPKVDGYMQIALTKPLTGDIFVNGEKGGKVNEMKTQIRINGNQVLGEFISEDGTSAFFYIPESSYFNGSYVTINPKTFDREKYIDKRRRWMYTSYSLLMVSLIPTFYTYGKLINQAKLYNDGFVKYSEAIELQKQSNTFRNISIGCGVFFGFELVRYLLAANSVLPQKARAGDSSLYEYYDFSIMEEEQTAEESENNIEINAEITEQADGE